MTTANDDFEKWAREVEAPLASYAKRSFEDAPELRSFLDGVEIRKFYFDLSRSGQVDNRTPIQRERDRIVHSAPLRKLAEKFHVIYYLDQRISRNYITHVMRMAQITRAICRQGCSTLIT